MTWAVRQIHCVVNSDAWFSTWQGNPHFHLRLELPPILSWVLLGSLLSEDGSDLKRQLLAHVLRTWAAGTGAEDAFRIWASEADTCHPDPQLLSLQWSLGPSHKRP